MATEAWQELLRNRDLTRKAANADARSKALRRWEHEWEIRVERALAGDETTLAAFKHPVDVNQMDYRESPALTIWTKLGSLGDYIPVQLRVEMNLQERWDTEGEQPISPPKTVFTAQELAEDALGQAHLRGSPRFPVVTDVAMARAYADKGPQDAIALVEAQRRAALDYLAATPPALRNLPPDRQSVVRAEFLRERAARILRGQRLLRVLTSMSVAQASQPGVEERWTPWVAQWSARVRQHRTDWWSSPGVTVGDLFAAAIGVDKVHFASAPVAPPPSWRAARARELKVGLDWLDKHAAPEPLAAQSSISPAISSQDQT